MKYNLVMVVIIACLFCSCIDNTKNIEHENRKEDSMQATGDSAIKQDNQAGKTGEIFVDDGGQAGLPVVLVHSFGGSTTNWKAQLDHLRKERRAIAFDLRGHGRSFIPDNDDYYVQTLANDIRKVVDDLNLKQFVLVGHSMGGSAAIDYAVRYPERVAGLMLVGTPGRTPSEQSKPIIASLESEKYDTVMEGYMKQLLKNARPEVEQEIRVGMGKITKPVSISIIKSIFEFDPVPALSGYPGPKLIVSSGGEQQANALSKQLPEIPHKIITGTSHWVQMDRPVEFNRILDEFLRKVEASLPKK